jgi:AraC family transcriptional activator FtrA
MAKVCLGRTMSKLAILGFYHVATFEVPGARCLVRSAITIFALPGPEYVNWYQADVVCFENTSLQVTGAIRISTKNILTLDDYQT